MLLVTDTLSKLLLGCGFFTFVLLCAFAADPPPGGLSQSLPESLGLLPARLRSLDEAVNASITANEIPGAVVLVARHGRIGYLKAFGNRALEPRREAMTIDTVFDIASLTKVVATAPSIMLLVENGSLRLEDKVKRYLPKFSGGNKESITVRQLLTHHSGLPPDFDLSKLGRGYAEAMDELWKTNTQSKPGEEFTYSDLNFIALAEIVRVLSGKTLDVFSKEYLFDRLGMTDTLFNPPSALRPRIAPTEPRRHTLAYLKGKGYPELSDQVLRGEVHDPTAWLMGGVTGHAGLFSTARDIAVYLQTLINKGTWENKRIFSPITVAAMTSPESPVDSPSIRGYGWDIQSSYSAPRGDLFKDGYGHTGFTGTSVWVHPPTDSFFILLTNRVHPEGKGDATHLRGVVANVVAAAIVE